MPKIFDCAQRELEWVKLRLGIPTASEFANIMTPLFKVKEGAARETYLCEKLAEKVQGHALPGFDSYSTEYGEAVEDEARNWFELNTGMEVRQVGFVLSEDERCGCSPDGLVGADAGLEIKCPAAHTHVKYLRANVVPPEYMAQVHGSMYVTGRSKWYFLSYRRGFKRLLLEVPRDEQIMEKIGAALAPFYADFDAALPTVKL